MNLDVQSNSSMEIAERVDARGLVCPMPTLRLGQAIRRIPVGAVLELISDDPGSERNMAAWTRNTGHELVRAAHENGTHVYCFRRVK